MLIIVKSIINSVVSIFLLLQTSFALRYVTW